MYSLPREPERCCGPAAPPHSCEVEHLLVAYAVASDTAAKRILPHVDARDFYDRRWRGCVELLKSGGPRPVELFEVCGYAVPAGWATADQIPTLVAWVRQLAERRRLAWALQVLAAATWDSCRPLRDEAGDVARVMRWAGRLRRLEGVA